MDTIRHTHRYKILKKNAVNNIMQWPKYSFHTIIIITRK